MYRLGQGVSYGAKEEILPLLKSEVMLLTTYNVRLPRDRKYPNGPENHISSAILEWFDPEMKEQSKPLETEKDGECLYRYSIYIIKDNPV